MSVVIVEYHEHQPVSRMIGEKAVWGCGYTRIDGTECPDFYAGTAGYPVRWSGSHTTTREAVEEHLRSLIAAALHAHDGPAPEQGTVHGIRPHRYPDTAEEAEQMRALALTQPPISPEAIRKVAAGDDQT